MKRVFPHRVFVGLAALCVYGLLASPLYGWSKAGHMTTAAIAYADLLDQDPDAARRVSVLLSNMASTEFRAAVQSNSSGGKRDLARFVFAARWPDDVRGSSEDKPLWHYINYPFLAPGSSVDTDPPDDSNIEVALARNLQIVKDTTASQIDRARAICWIFHLFGDGHQPLHSAKIFSDVFPNGDRGGTRFYVKTRPSGYTVDLHGLWDGAVIGTENFQSVRNRGTQLRNRYPRSSFTNLNESDYKEWIKESLELAKATAYRNGSLEGSANSQSGSLLPSGYTTDMKVAAEKRATLAGYRLADFLAKTF